MSMLDHSWGEVKLGPRSCWMAPHSIYGPTQNILGLVEEKGSNNLAYSLHRFPIFQNWSDNCNLGNAKSCDAQHNFKLWDKNRFVRSPWFSCSRISRATKLKSKSLQIRSSLASKNNKTHNQKKSEKKWRHFTFCLPSLPWQVHKIWRSPAYPEPSMEL